MEEIEVPQYFICPISLQIMKDPVTAITGITYDRESIEKWLLSSKNTICPVTKQPLSKDSDLTPNHTLRRLIQAWCTLNAGNGVDRIPTPKSPLYKIHVQKLIRDLWVPHLQSKSLKKLEVLASENERNRKCMAESGVAKAMVSFILSSLKKSQMEGLEESLNILNHVRISSEEMKNLGIEINDLITSLMWVLQTQMESGVSLKTNAVKALKIVIEASNSNFLELLRPEFFEGIVQVLREKISIQATKSALQILLEACPWGRNRIKIVEAGAVFELIEIEMGMPEKRITELILGVLHHLCSCADGRSQFLSHAGGIAMVSKRILRVSPTATDRGVHILGLISKFSATIEVLHEMLRVGAVSKVCMVLQADCEKNVKDKARTVLRLHNNVWNNSPCISVYLLTGYPR